MYCTRDFKTKKALKDAVANGDLVELVVHFPKEEAQ